MWDKFFDDWKSDSSTEQQRNDARIKLKNLGDDLDKLEDSARAAELARILEEDKLRREGWDEEHRVKWEAEEEEYRLKRVATKADAAKKAEDAAKKAEDAAKKNAPEAVEVDPAQQLKKAKESTNAAVEAARAAVE